MTDLGRGPVGVDTVVFISFIEEHPQFVPLLEPLFREVDGGSPGIGYVGAYLVGGLGCSLSFRRSSAG